MVLNGNPVSKHKFMISRIAVVKLVESFDTYFYAF